MLLYGRLESGDPFLVRDDREVPHFYIPAKDRDAAHRLGARKLVPSVRRFLHTHEKVLRVEVDIPGDTPELRDHLRESGIPCFEADIRFPVRYLIERGIRGTVRIRGETRNGDGNGSLHVFENPELAPGDWAPDLRVLSFDIETDPTANKLLAISFYGCGAAEVLLLTGKGMSCPAGATPCASERSLLETFARRIEELDPDLLTGWNILEFDVPVLLKVARRRGLHLLWGRTDEGLRILKPRSRREMPRAVVPGRLVLDGIQLVRGSFLRMESYSLNAVANEVLGEGKTITSSDRGQEISRQFAEDREAFVEYSLTDSRLVHEILERLQLVQLSVERSRLTGMTPDRVTASIASFDFLYLMALRRRGIVAPSVGEEDREAGSSGGHVLEPQPGLYRNVLALDFKSLYPSLIRTFQIDPLGFVESPVLGEDLIEAPNGARFRRETGILTGMLDELFPRREEAKRTGDKAKSQAIKILMNSFYGVLGSSACRFHDSRIANAITSFGRELLLWSRDRIRSYGHPVLYGDTDSLFVLSNTETAEEGRKAGEKIVARLNEDLDRHIRETWRVPSRLELEFERLYLRLVLTPVRKGLIGARKRYAGLIERGGKKEVVFTGMEAVRRDWTELARRVQTELYERLFSDQPVEAYLREVIADLKARRLDDLLVYRKSLRKRTEEYTKTTPPHVVAARKMSGPPRRVIRYAMTTAGPEPEDERVNPFDDSHYIQKQIRPVAEPVLVLLGLDFDQVLSGQKQFRLFE